MTMEHLPLAAVVTALALYPLVLVAHAAPHFPSRNDCVHHLVEGKEIEAVFGRFDRADDAEAEYRRVLGAGFSGTLLKPDGCGLLKVAVHGIPNVEVGQEFAAEATKAGFHVTLEQYVP
jgi:hypothetical protein